MKKIILPVLLLVGSCSVFSQSIENNLHKYWQYRERLRKFFVVVSPNDEPGTNIPFTVIRNDNNTDRSGIIGPSLGSGDGNGGLQYYIGLLASEYKLLREFGMDYTQTRNELIYALKAVNRLDRTAETYYQKDGVYGQENLNGFFIRDDIPWNFTDIWKDKGYPQLAGYKVSSMFMHWDEGIFKGPNEINNGTTGPYEMSKDNVWNYLLNFSLVLKIVDDKEIKQMVKDIAYRMVTYLLSNGNYIKNPVTGLNVEDGAMIVELNNALFYDGFDYGFGEAGSRLSGKDCHTSISKNHGADFYKTLGGLYLCYPSESGSPYAFMCLAIPNSWTRMGLDNKNSKYKTIYDEAVYRIEHTTCANYVHFPLYTILVKGEQGTFDPFSQSKYDFYLELLNTAPQCGPSNLGPDDPDKVIGWETGNQLVWPNKFYDFSTSPPIYTDNSWWYGVYNGIDYMVLHNLFWLLYVEKITRLEYVSDISYNWSTIISYILPHFPGLTPYGSKDTAINPCALKLTLPSTKSANSLPDSINYFSISPKNNDTESSLYCFPNPVKTKLYFNGAGDVSIKIYDLFGKEIVSFKNVYNYVDLSELKDGLYFFKIQYYEKTIMGKIIKE